MKKIKLLSILCLIFISTGCFKKDSLEDITIYTSSYPIEYIVEYLYGDNSTVESIYPDGVNINTYELNDKQIKDYSKADMFVFNGLSNDSEYLTKMVENNSNLMIIDSSRTMEYTYNIEELWLDPSNFLMLALNIKNGLQEYITNYYLKENIETKYEELKIEVSNIDAELKLLSENADNLTIVTDSNMFKFLEKYGFTVISLENDTLIDKKINAASVFLKSTTNKYIYVTDVNNVSDTINNLLLSTGSKLIELHDLSNLTEDERSNKDDYLSLLNDNIELLKTTLYN